MHVGAIDWYAVRTGVRNSRPTNLVGCRGESGEL